MFFAVPLGTVRLQSFSATQAIAVWQLNGKATNRYQSRCLSLSTPPQSGTMYHKVKSRMRKMNCEGNVLSMCSKLGELAPVPRCPILNIGLIIL